MRFSKEKRESFRSDSFLFPRRVEKEMLAAPMRTKQPLLRATKQTNEEGRRRRSLGRAPGYREWEGGGGGRRRRGVEGRERAGDGRGKMKKSPMPCERRDLSSMTPDEPAKDAKGECRHTPQATFTVRRKRHGTQPVRRLCVDRSTCLLLCPPFPSSSALIYARYRMRIFLLWEQVLPAEQTTVLLLVIDKCRAKVFLFSKE